jgi:hypothetical protein
MSAPTGSKLSIDALESNDPERHVQPRFPLAQTGLAAVAHTAALRAQSEVAILERMDGAPAAASVAYRGIAHFGFSDRSEGSPKSAALTVEEAPPSSHSTSLSWFDYLHQTDPWQHLDDTATKDGQRSKSVRIARRERKARAEQKRAQQDQVAVAGTLTDNSSAATFSSPIQQLDLLPTDQALARSLTVQEQRKVARVRGGDLKVPKSKLKEQWIVVGVWLASRQFPHLPFFLPLVDSDTGKRLDLGVPYLTLMAALSPKYTDRDRILLHARVVQRLDDQGRLFGEVRYLCTDIAASYEMGDNAFRWIIFQSVHCSHLPLP